MDVEDQDGTVEPGPAGPWMSTVEEGTGDVTADNGAPPPSPHASNEASTGDATTRRSSSAADASPSQLSSPEPPRWRFIEGAKKSSGFSSRDAGIEVEGLSGEEVVSKFSVPAWKCRLLAAKKAEKEAEDAERKDDEVLSAYISASHPQDDSEVTLASLAGWVTLERERLETTDRDVDRLDREVLRAMEERTALHSPRARVEILDGGDDDDTNDDGNDDRGSVEESAVADGENAGAGSELRRLRAAADANVAQTELLLVEARRDRIEARRLLTKLEDLEKEATRRERKAEAEARARAEEEAARNENEPSAEESGAMYTVPEPPKWRFVNIAKKSSGYSASDAGKTVEGLTADELGATYTAPALEEVQNEEERNIGRLDIMMPDPENGLAGSNVDADCEKEREADPDELAAGVISDAHTGIIIRGSKEEPRGMAPHEVDVSTAAESMAMETKDSSVERKRTTKKKKCLLFALLLLFALVAALGITFGLKKDAAAEPPGAKGIIIVASDGNEVNTTAPSQPPSEVRTDAPGRFPSSIPTAVPSVLPTDTPSRFPSSTPTVVPSGVPSSIPTEVPSDHPTISPSVIPTISATGSPVQDPFLIGGCDVNEYNPYRRYRLGFQVKSEGIIYECKRSTCWINMNAIPGKGKIWRNVWIMIGVCAGSSSSAAPPPTNTLASSSLCPVDDDFHVCLALDMSGSVCNGGRPTDCGDCDSECSTGGVPKDVCCSNFYDVVAFSEAVVAVLDGLPMTPTFSIVGFADESRLLAGSVNADDARSVLSNLIYSGGGMNLRDPLARCQSSFSLAGDDTRNFIVVITDGRPSQPGPNPREDAESTADAAKAAGTTILPVFIDGGVADLEFMAGIGSDGTVLDVSSVNDLGDLRETLVEKIWCHQSVVAPFQEEAIR